MLIQDPPSPAVVAIVAQRGPATLAKVPLLLSVFIRVNPWTFLVKGEPRKAKPHALPFVVSVFDTPTTRDKGKIRDHFSTGLDSAAPSPDPSTSKPWRKETRSRVLPSCLRARPR